MTTFPRPPRHSLFLLTGISSLSLLAACDMMSNSSNPFSDGRPTQQVNGPRRVPVMNQAWMAKTQGAAAPNAAPERNTPPPSMLDDPYDYYDADGNVAVKKAPQSASAADAAPGLLGRVFGASGKPEEVRKPFPGNPGYSRETSPTAPLPPSPQLSSSADERAPAPLVAVPEVPKQMAAKAGPAPFVPVNPAPAVAAEVPAEPENIEALQQQNETPVAEEAAAAKPAEKTEMRRPNLLERWFGGSDEPPVPAGEQVAQQVTVDKNAPYPDLSSVPPRPSQFSDIQASRQDKLDELKNSRSQAQQDKQDLDSEPSQQQQPMTPVEAPAGETKTETAPANEPVLLGHVAAPPELANTPPSVTPAIDTSSEAMPSPSAPSAAVAVPAGEPVPAVHVEAAQKMMSPAPEKTGPVDAQALAESPVPDDQLSDDNLPPGYGRALPVLPADESDTADSGDNTGEVPAVSLPSPQILRKVKMLPPSRYSVREQALQHMPAAN